MTRRFSLSVLSAALALLATLLAAPVSRARADDPPADESTEPQTREFTEQNFKWTIPAKWAFVEPPEADKGVGYVIIARRVVSKGVEMSAYASVVDAGSSTVESEFAIAKENKLKGLADPKVEEGDVSWAGAGGARRMKITGKAENGSRLAWFTYGGIVKGKYHQLDLRSANGAYVDLQAEVDALVKGYAFLDGAAAADAAPAAPGGAGTYRFETLKLTWTLPEKVAPAADGVEVKQEPSTSMKLDADPSLKAEFARVQLRVNGEALGAVVLTTEPAQMGATPVGYVRTEQNFKGDQDQMDGPAVPEIDETVKIGNAQGALRGTSGKSKESGKPLLIRKYYVVIGEALFMVISVSNQEVHKTYKDWFKAVLAGLKWDDAVGGVRGPWLTPFPSFTAVRKEEKKQFQPGEKTTVTNSIVSFVKPEKWALIRYELPSAPAWATAMEARDTDAYCFIGFLKYPADQFQKDKKDPDTLIEALESDWKNSFEDPVTRTGKDKLKKPDSFRGAKGSSYEFKGKKAGIPYVERGYVVKSGPNVIHVRIQYGGTAGEAKLKGDVDKLLGSVKFV